MPTKPLRMWTPDIVRKRMQTTRIVKRLTQFALGENDDANQKVEMSQAQVRAALGLLAKTLPDLSSMEYRDVSKHRPVEEWTDAEIYAELSRIRDARERALREALGNGQEPLAGPPAPGEIH